MEFLTLNNGVQMPLVGFGTFMLGGEICTEAVATAIQSGYRMIDTAEAYGNEKEVGAGIRQSGIDRKELFLVTKVNFKSYEHAGQAVMQSLNNLQTDYIYWTPIKIFRKDFNCPKGKEFIWDLFCDFFPYKSQNWQRH